jgi:hypothetical protein
MIHYALYYKIRSHVELLVKKLNHGKQLIATSTSVHSQQNLLPTRCLLILPNPSSVINSAYISTSHFEYISVDTISVTMRELRIGVESNVDYLRTGLD